jgi:methylmalonyl-CoA mutase cobalamin-binding domain/chain
MTTKEELKGVVIDLDEDKAHSLVKSLLNEGVDPQELIETLREAVDIIGEKYEKKEYFLTELVMAGEIFKDSAKLIEPQLKKTQKFEKPKGIVVMGTVKGDVHDIGKNIFTTLLKSAGFEVYDLGVDVPPEDFVKKVKETNANYVGYSGLLTVALESMKKTTKLLQKEGIREKVKIIIGGLPVDEMWMKEARADAYTDNAFTGVKKIKEWAGVE